jgi:hypothetical protein
MGSSVGSLICSLVASPIFNIFSRSPVGARSIPTALMVWGEPEKVIGGKDEPSINRSVGNYEEGLLLKLGGGLPLFIRLPLARL